MNLPNKLTLFRVILIPFFVFFLLAQCHFGWFEGYGNYIAVAIFAIASLTDLLDGKIARKYNLVTNFGKFMDPLADKLLVCSAMICLVDMKLLPSWVVIIIIAREFIISAFRQIAAANGIIMAAEKLGKYKTVCQDIALFILLLAADIPALAGQIVAGIGFGLLAVATVLTIWSGIAYVVKNKQVIKED